MFCFNLRSFRADFSSDESVLAVYWHFSITWPVQLFTCLDQNGSKKKLKIFNFFCDPWRIETDRNSCIEFYPIRVFNTCHVVRKIWGRRVNRLKKGINYSLKGKEFFQNLSKTDLCNLFPIQVDFNRWIGSVRKLEANRSDPLQIFRSGHKPLFKNKQGRKFFFLFAWLMKMYNFDKESI